LVCGRREGIRSPDVQRVRADALSEVVRLQASSEQQASIERILFNKERRQLATVSHDLDSLHPKADGDNPNWRLCLYGSGLPVGF
jgi:stress response protein SCP2